LKRAPEGAGKWRAAGGEGAKKVLGFELWVEERLKARYGVRGQRLGEEGFELKSACVARAKANLGHAMA
jgi:hypothetical protein